MLSWLRREGHPTSISYVHKVFQHLDMNCIFLTYVDGCITVGDSHDQINLLIQSLHEGDENFVLQDKGLIDKYLRVRS